jgi:hypothetical protein
MWQLLMLLTRAVYCMMRVSRACSILLTRAYLTICNMWMSRSIVRRGHFRLCLSKTMCPCEHTYEHTCKQRRGDMWLSLCLTVCIKLAVGMMGSGAWAALAAFKNLHSRVDTLAASSIWRTSTKYKEYNDFTTLGLVDFKVDSHVL